MGVIDDGVEWEGIDEQGGDCTAARAAAWEDAAAWCKPGITCGWPGPTGNPCKP